MGYSAKRNNQAREKKSEAHPNPVVSGELQRGAISSALAGLAARSPPHQRGSLSLSRRLHHTNVMANTATIKWFDRKKGYGFASPEGGGDDIFVHALNLTKDEGNKQPFVDDGDVIYYDLGEHNGRPTAINVSFPPDRPARPRRRTRGRNANKDADAEAEALADEEQSAADARESKDGENGGDKPPRAGGGRDGKTHRANNGRPRRNDKGLGGGRPKGGSKPPARQGKARAQRPRPAGPDAQCAPSFALAAPRRSLRKPRSPALSPLPRSQRARRRLPACSPRRRKTPHRRPRTAARRSRRLPTRPQSEPEARASLLWQARLHRHRSRSQDF